MRIHKHTAHYIIHKVYSIYAFVKWLHPINFNNRSQKTPYNEQTIYRQLCILNPLPAGQFSVKMMSPFNVRPRHQLNRLNAMRVSNPRPSYRHANVTTTITTS